MSDGAVDDELVELAEPDCGGVGGVVKPGTIVPFVK